MYTSPQNPSPIVLVHGLLGWGETELRPINYWRGLDNWKKWDCQRMANGTFCQGVLELEVSAVSSLHDRACELFYKLKGIGYSNPETGLKQVDYGEEHAQEHGHSRWGAELEAALLPNWSADEPIHLVGHSMGAPTIRMLQWLLDQQYFEGVETSSDWILSVTTISGVNNGSTAPYLLGASEKTGKLTRQSAGDFIARTATIYSALAPKKLSDIYDFDLPQWGLRRRTGESLFDFSKRLFNDNAFARGVDNPVFDLSVHGMSFWNERLKTYSNTYYFAWATAQTQRGWRGYHRPSLTMNPLLRLTARWIGRKKFDPPLVPGFVSEDWWQNDGLVSVAGQLHPFLPTAQPFVKWQQLEEEAGKEQPAPSVGLWHDMPVLDDWDHIDIVGLSEFRQLRGRRKFYAQHFEMLRRLPLVGRGSGE